MWFDVAGMRCLTAVTPAERSCRCPSRQRVPPGLPPAIRKSPAPSRVRPRRTPRPAPPPEPLAQDRRGARRSSGSDPSALWTPSPRRRPRPVPEWRAGARARASPPGSPSARRGYTRTAAALPRAQRPRSAARSARASLAGHQAERSGSSLRPPHLAKPSSSTFGPLLPQALNQENPLAAHPHPAGAELPLPPGRPEPRPPRRRQVLFQVLLAVPLHGSLRRTEWACYQQDSARCLRQPPSSARLPLAGGDQAAGLDVDPGELCREITQRLLHGGLCRLLDLLLRRSRQRHPAEVRRAEREHRAALG